MDLSRIQALAETYEEYLGIAAEPVQSVAATFEPVIRELDRRLAIPPSDPSPKHLRYVRRYSLVVGAYAFRCHRYLVDEGLVAGAVWTDHERAAAAIEALNPPLEQSWRDATDPLS